MTAPFWRVDRRLDTTGRGGHRAEIATSAKATTSAGWGLLAHVDVPTRADGQKTYVRGSGRAGRTSATNRTGRTSAVRSRTGRTSAASASLRCSGIHVCLERNLNALVHPPTRARPTRRGR